MEEQVITVRRRKRTKPALVHVNVRVPPSVMEFYRQYPNYTAKMRSVLAEYAQKETAKETEQTA